MLPSNAFTDGDVPANLSVFNVQLISSNLLFVTYAPTNALGNGTAPGAGFVSVYSADGTLVGHLRHGPWMNAPWGVTWMPGHDGGTLLVGMFGNGQIATFDAEHGHFRGLLRGAHDRPIEIGKGLWGLGFGNGANAGPTNWLYFATDRMTTNGFHGIFGALTPMKHSSHGDDDSQGSDGNADN